MSRGLTLHELLRPTVSEHAIDTTDMSDEEFRRLVPLAYRSDDD